MNGPLSNQILGSIDRRKNPFDVQQLITLVLVIQLCITHLPIEFAAIYQQVFKKYPTFVYSIHEHYILMSAKLKS